MLANRLCFVVSEDLYLNSSNLDIRECKENQVEKGMNMLSGSDREFEFRIFVSRPFTKSVEKIREQQLKKRIYECMRTLALGFDEWKHLRVKKIDVGDSGKLMLSARVNDQMRMLFEGPVYDRNFGRFLFIHDVSGHNEYIRKLRKIRGAGSGKGKFSEIELTAEERAQGSKGLESETAAFSKLIPAKALLSPDRIEAILNSPKANLLLTKKQMEALSGERPLLIHGQAGSGKTTLLCHRLALSVLSRRSHPPAKFVFLSYNDKLVKQALADTREILVNQYDSSESLEGVEFTPFQTFLKHYVPSASQFEAEYYVPFGRFKQYYEVYKRGNPVARRIPPEVAWHGIRSILKGACVPPSRPPLSGNAYKDLARRRRDLPEDMFNDIYEIGEWYQKDIIKDKKLWDDQDLAWVALNWVMTEKRTNPQMLLYDEIFCDEGQDLTEIEFRLLVALCKQPMPKAKEGLPLIFAGDPLQTINPTGFRWSIIGSEVYRVQDKPVKFHELQENFRSDIRIVKFADQIREIRSRYMGQRHHEQEAFDQDGFIPQVLVADTKDEISIIQKKLGELPPESAVIVWPEGSDEVSQLFETEEALTRVDRQLDLYSISEAKGLEFRLVVLYKFGSSSEVLQWKNYLMEELKPPLEQDIPLLYFLNRLYVATTRAKTFLVVIDTKAGVDNLWSIWKDSLYFLPRSDTRNFLESHPAFKGEVSDVAWRRWAEILFEQAEKNRDLRLYERARRAYEKANETQSVKRVDARLMEIAEQWAKAGKIYFDINEFEKARQCFDSGGLWSDAYKACAMLPTTPKTKRHMATYKFKMGMKQDAPKAAMEFYDYFLTDDHLDREHLSELGNVLLRMGANNQAAEVFLRIARKFADRGALVQAADSFFKAGNFENAENLYAEAGETQRREYQLSRAENLLRKRELPKAVELFFKNDAFEKVVEIYEMAEQQGLTLPREQLLEWVANSYFKLERYGKALLAYQSLREEFRKPDDTQILQRIAECFEKLDEKPKAYNLYREARAFEQALELAQELDRPPEEILSLKIEAAREAADFDSAIKFAEEKGDNRLLHELKAHSHSYRKEYLKAVQEFVEAEAWNKALNALDLFIGGSDFTPSELHSQSWNIARAVAKSKQAIHVDKEKLMRVIRQIQEEPAWEEHVAPSDIGLVYEKCAVFSEAISYYESRIHETWAQEGWIRVMSAYRDSFKQMGDFKNAQRIEDEIPVRRKILGF
jgi:tetratricopeptide (TPR) repeat protein